MRFFDWITNLSEDNFGIEYYHLPDDENNEYLKESAHLPFDKRMTKKEKQEYDIRRALKQIGFVIKKEGGISADKDKKVDAKIGIDKVQFKNKDVKEDKNGNPLVDVWSSSFKPSDVFFAEAIINFNDDKIPVEKYLNKQDAIGRDLRTESKWFFILNERKDKVFKIDSKSIENYIRDAISDVKNDPKLQGLLAHPKPRDDGSTPSTMYKTNGGYKLQVKLEFTPRQMWKILVLFPFMEKAEKVYDIPAVTLKPEDDGYGELPKNIKLHPDMLSHGYKPPEASPAETAQQSLPKKPAPVGSRDFVVKLVNDTGKAIVPIKKDSQKTPEEQLKNWQNGLQDYNVKVKIVGDNFVFEPK